jgi:hypothetical protein
VSSNATYKVVVLELIEPLYHERRQRSRFIIYYSK